MGNLLTNLVKKGESAKIALASAFNGTTCYWIKPDDLKDFWRSNRESDVIAYNSGFDILHTADFINDKRLPFDLCDNKRIKDSFVLSRLINLALTGNSKAKGITLAAMVKKYLGVDLPKEVMVNGKEVRLSYGDFESTDEMEGAYFFYNAIDTISTYHLWDVQKKEAENIAKEHGANYEDLLSHYRQIEALIATQLSTKLGLKIDQETTQGIYDKFERELVELDAELKEHGYWPGGGSQDRFGDILKKIEVERNIGFETKYHRGRKKEVYSQAVESLTPFEDIPFVKTFLKRAKIAKLQSTFVKPLIGKEEIHQTYDIIKETTRVSSLNPNTQNYPRPETSLGINLRGCFIPREGYDYYISDYTGAELCTAAQHVINLGYESNLGEKLNNKEDIHKFIAAKYLGVKQAEVTKEQRILGKIVNFSRITSSGRATIARAGKSYGVSLTETDAAKLISVWEKAFPEFKQFFKTAEDTNLRALNLDNKYDYYKLVDIAGGKDENRFGRGYTEEDKEWAFEHLDSLPAFRGVTEPSEELAKRIDRQRASVIKTSGVIRGNCTYTEFLNNFIQAGQALITNTTWYRLHKAGFRVVNCVHDEVIVEIKKEEQKTQIKEIESIMIATAREFCPDINMSTEGATLKRWEKI